MVRLIYLKELRGGEFSTVVCDDRFFPSVWEIPASLASIDIECARAPVVFQTFVSKSIYLSHLYISIYFCFIPSYLCVFFLKATTSTLTFESNWIEKESNHLERFSKPVVCLSSSTLRLTGFLRVRISEESLGPMVWDRPIKGSGV